jgi:tRNA 5-methylaminomethyl-2-thiouridine biosynthesis bifunctional protein
MGMSTRCDVVIVGGGLAGGFTAHAFASRGATVTLLESCPALASRASGNRFALLTPYITTKASPLESLYSVGFDFSSSTIASSDRLARLLHRCGALQLPATGRLRNALAGDSSLLGVAKVQRLSSEEASELAAIAIPSWAFYIPDAGFIDPAEAIRQLIQEYESTINVHCDSSVASLSRAVNGWDICCKDGTKYSAPIVIICGAYETAALEICSWLPLEPIRGQTVSATPSQHSANLRTVLAFGGYLTPVVDGMHFIGAHYRHDDPNPEPSDEDTADVLMRCAKWLPETKLDSSQTTGARVCFRTSTIDRLPYVGALPDFFEMQRQASMYRSGSDIAARVPLRHHEGLYVHVGHGSRGLLSCPLGAEVVARMANRESLAELSDVALIMSPDRVPYRVL